MRLTTWAEGNNSEQLAFDRLLGDLSARFADLPAEQAVNEIDHALTHLFDFLGFDRCSFGEFRNSPGPNAAENESEQSRQNAQASLWRCLLRHLW